MKGRCFHDNDNNNDGFTSWVGPCSIKSDKLKLQTRNGGKNSKQPYARQTCV